MSHDPATAGAPLTPAEAAELLGMHSRSVARTAHAGVLTTVRTLGGHRRYLRVQVLALARTRAARDGAS